MSQAGAKRYRGVDWLRGVAVGFMVVANNPGDTQHVYRELLHAKWHGWTAVDFIFPVFLFLVGVSVALAVSPGAVGLWPKAFRRAAWLFGLGLVVNGFPFFDLASLRIPGVLQRIAVVYLAALWLHTRAGSSGLAATAGVILLGYWLLWAFVPVPGLGYPTMDFEYNLEGWLDQMLMRGHIWEYDTTWDPEGILSTIPCVALACIGVLGGRWLKSGAAAPGPWAVVGLGGLMHFSGLAWDAWFPINKLITTSSFVLFVGGFALALLACAHLWLDRGPEKTWMIPMLALGQNALFLFVLSQILTKILYVTKVPWKDGGTKSLHFWLFETLFGAIPDRFAASVAWALTLLAILTLAAMFMRRRGLTVRL